MGYDTDYNPFAPDGNETEVEKMLGELAEPALLGIAIADARAAAAEDVIYGRAEGLPPIDETKTAKLLGDIAIVEAAISRKPPQ